MSKRVVVVGGSGKVGGFVIRHLVDTGYEVRNVDQRTPVDGHDCPTSIIDARDAGQVYSALAGAEAVVHLAAYPTADGPPGGVIFGDNTRITYNVLEAASNYGIRRVVCLSTMAVIYYPQPTWYAFEPCYLPVDEAHPPTHRNAYSLSKQVGELTAEMFNRLGRTVVVSLRPAWIVTPGEIWAKGLLDPENLEQGLYGLWSYMDARDVARACQAALEADLTGHEVFNLSAPDTFAPIPTLDLVRKLWPALTDFRGDLGGYRPLIDCRKAARLLAFESIYSVRKEAEKDCTK
jgi:nucleoside-diphosphate-sugar epimerase